MSPYYNPYLSPSSVIWVQGLAGAQGYAVAPGQTVPLFDSDEQIIYLKSVDMAGRPSMKTLDYTIREDAVKENYVTKDELEKMIKDLKESLHG